MDFVDKKEKLVGLLEDYLDDNEKENELMQYINELSNDVDFVNKDLFRNIFEEIQKYLPELSKKEIKQRILMIRGYIE